MTSKRRRARLFLVFGLAAVAIAVLFVAVVEVILAPGPRFAENVILCEAPREQAIWRLIETPRGKLIRMAGGPFRGWYLARDDQNAAMGAPTTPTIVISILPRPRTGAYARDLVLRSALDDDCYWELTESTDRGDHFAIAAKNGPRAGWQLGMLVDYTPDDDSDPRTAWNLALFETPSDAARWELETESGWLRIRARNDSPFDGWYLDALDDAWILDREASERERGGSSRTQHPPLATQRPPAAVGGGPR